MRLLELYTTVQGEGPNVGKPTTFVRFAGCNMRCPGWPCDTPYSIFPEQWKQEMVNRTPQEVLEMIVQETPMHICITGGEPLIQPQVEMKELLWALHRERYTVDIFTNGSRPIYGGNPFVNYLHHHVTFIMDWKLPGSGEGDSFLEQRSANLEVLRKTDAVKLVIKDEVDLNEAAVLIEKWHPHSWTEGPQVYVGAAWGEMDEAALVHWLNVNRYSWVKLNVQMHKYIFDPNARRI